MLVLDEPINGLDADGVRIVREILKAVASKGCTVVVSSHVLGELEKVATHYGIIKGGKMIREMTAEELNASCPVYIALKAKDMQLTECLLRKKYGKVKTDEKGYLRIYDNVSPEETVEYLYGLGILVSEIHTAKIGLEEYYVDLMKGGR